MRFAEARLLSAPASREGDGPTPGRLHRAWLPDDPFSFRDLTVPYLHNGKSGCERKSQLLAAGRECLRVVRRRSAASTHDRLRVRVRPEWLSRFTVSRARRGARSASPRESGTRRNRPALGAPAASRTARAALVPAAAARARHSHAPG